MGRSADADVTDFAPQRQLEPSAAGATLSIGTIEVTVLPPRDNTRDNKSAAPAQRTVPAGPPDRLSRGLGPWFGRDQA